MKLSSPQKLKDIAGIIGATFDGDPDHIVTGLNEIHMVEPGDLVFVDHPKYYDKALQSKATTVLLNKKVECPTGKALIFTDDPFSAYNRLVEHFHPRVYSSAPISPNAKIGKNTLIMPGVYVGDNVTIGNNCKIHPNVVIYNDCVIGNNVTIQAGCVIGSDAFYYKKRETHFEKLISCGRVVIEDNVELGGNCVIDKGVSGDTIIGEGTIFDNLVHIAHDVQLGKMCLIAGQVAIAGATKVGNRVTMWGQVGVTSGVTIGDGAVLQAQCGVAKSLEGGKSYFGSPAGESREKMKEMAMVRRIPDILEKLR